MAIDAEGKASSAPTSRTSIANAVRIGVRARRVHRGGLHVDTVDRIEAEPSGADRQNARTTADVEQRPWLDVLKQLQAQLRGRMRTGAERATGVDHDRERPGGRLLPGRPDPEAADLDRPVERLPAVLPAILDVGRLGGAEHVPDALLARRVGVGDQLRRAHVLDLFEPVGEECEHRRARLLDARVADLDGDAAEAQRNALFSFSKKPSSCLYVCSSLAASNSASKRRCSSDRRLGTVTFTSTR